MPSSSKSAERSAAFFENSAFVGAKYTKQKRAATDVPARRLARRFASPAVAAAAPPLDAAALLERRKEEVRVLEELVQQRSTLQILQSMLERQADIDIDAEGVRDIENQRVALEQREREVAERYGWTPSAIAASAPLHTRLGAMLEQATSGSDQPQATLARCDGNELHALQGRCLTLLRACQQEIATQILRQTR